MNQFANILKKNWFIILIAFLSVFISTCILTFSMKPVYEATATIFIRMGGDISGQLFDSPIFPRQKSLIKIHVSILESRNLATATVLRMEKENNCDSLSIFKKDTTRESIWQIPKKILKIKSPQIDNSEYSFFEVVNNFLNATKVSYGMESEIIELKAKAPTPKEAAYIVNTWIDAYQEYERSDTQEEIIQTKEFLAQKLKDIQKKLELSENLLSEYQKKNQLISLPKETEQLVTQLSSFESLFNQTKTDLDALESELSYIEGQLDESRKNLVKNMIDISSPILIELQKQMAELVAQKAAYEAQLLGAGYDIKKDAKLKQMDNRLQGIKEKVISETKKLAQTDLLNMKPLDHSEKLISNILELRISQKSLISRKNTLMDIIDEYNNKLQDLPDKSRALARLEREVQVNNKIYEMIREKYEEAKIREAGQIGIIRVVDRATPPLAPVLPKTGLNILLGLLFGLLFGISLAFYKEYLKDSVNGVFDIESMGINVIGSIPIIKDKKTKLKRGQENLRIARAKNILPYIMNRSEKNQAIYEAYRAVRTSIYFHKQHNGLKTILFTSPGASEGKSATVANLAITMAQKGLKTLLVDTDLRQPVLDLLFLSSKRKNGLTNHLDKRLSWQKAVRETVVKDLHLLAAGPSVKNASELLGSKWMDMFINDVKNDYHIVLFDSPPLLPVTDATILASKVDGIVLVIKEGKTTKRNIARSIELINSVKGNLLGSVITGIQEKEQYGYKDYYRNYGLEHNRNSNF